MAEKQRLKYTELSPDGIAALSALEHFLNALAGLDRSLLELVRLRASLLNGCEYCVGMHSHELTKIHEPEGRIAEVAGWRDSNAYTQRERAALRWTEVVTNIQDGHAPEAEYLAALEYFSETELVNLTLAIATINAWNRIAIAFRPQHHEKPAAERSAVDDDGGKVSVEE